MSISCVFISRSFWIREIVDCKHCHVGHVGGSPKWCATTKFDRRLGFKPKYVSKLHISLGITLIQHLLHSPRSWVCSTWFLFIVGVKVFQLRGKQTGILTWNHLPWTRFLYGFVLVIVCYLFWDSGAFWWEAVWNFFSSHQKSWYRTHSGWAASRNIRWSSVPW